MTSPNSIRRARAFTLIELLVTIGIITILVSILIPTISRVRRSAQATTVQNQINSLSAAIERFYHEQGRYPGPLADAELETASKGSTARNIKGMTRADHITSSENLVLGLLGGFKWVLTGTNYDLTFDANMVGKGMIGMNPGQPKKYQPYLEVQSAWISKGKYSDDSAPDPSGTGAGGANDSEIPEFLDLFSNPMPIIYLRAKAGASGVIIDDAGQWSPTNTPSCQYYLTDLLPYTVAQNGSLGAGKGIKQSAYKNYNGPTPPTPVFLPHGLVAVDPQSTIHQNDTSVPPKTYRYPYDAYAYFVSPSGTASTPVARSKDTYILISAGADRVYGTDDDICSFGALKP